MGDCLRTILMVDDDEDDCFVVKSVFEGMDLSCRCHIGFLSNGQELIDYLRRDGKYSDPASSPRPDLILMDLNMPRKDGREALREMKEDPILREYPVVVLSTSSADEDRILSRKLGALSFITKPASYGEWIEILRSLAEGRLLECDDD